MASNANSADSTLKFSFKFSHELDPTQFHCIRYIGAPLTNNHDKSAVYYVFETDNGHKFISPLTFTWTFTETNLLILPFWMRKFKNIGDEGEMKFRRVSVDEMEEFNGTLDLKWFGKLRPASSSMAASVISEVLNEILGMKRPLISGTVLPFIWRGRRYLLQVQVQLDQDLNGTVFYFDLERGKLNLIEEKLDDFTMNKGNIVNLLIENCWSEEFKVLKYQLNQDKNDNDHNNNEQLKVFLIIGIPVLLQNSFIEALKMEFEPLNVTEMIPEEHLVIEDEEDNFMEYDELELTELKSKNIFHFIGEVEKLPTNLITEIFSKNRKKPKKSFILSSSAVSIESSVKLLELERIARRFNYQVNISVFPSLTEFERIKIIQKECKDQVGEEVFDTFKWTLNSMPLTDLMRIGRNFNGSAKETKKTIMERFKMAVEVVKSSESESEQTHLYTILSGVNVNYPFYGYKKLKSDFENLLKGPLMNSEAYDRFGLPKSSGFLLHGPTGCGKTSLCLNVLTNSQFNNIFTVFHVTSASQLLSKYFGETEANIRKLFAQARERKPSIIFIDQIECLGRKRGESASNNSSDRYLSTLLNEMDGISGNEGVTVIVCANEIEMLDEALLRPGRLDKHILINLPDLADRKEIICGYLGDGENFDEMAKFAEGYSGADIKSFCKQIKRKKT